MQEDSFWPHLELFTGSDKFRNQEFVSVSTDVIHQTFGLVFGVQNSQISIDTVVGTLERHSLL